mgnify:CR=1 FL=1
MAEALLRAKADVAATDKVRNEWCNAGEGERGEQGRGKGMDGGKGSRVD